MLKLQKELHKVRTVKLHPTLKTLNLNAGRWCSTRLTLVAQNNVSCSITHWACSAVADEVVLWLMRAAGCSTVQEMILIKVLTLRCCILHFKQTDSDTRAADGRNLMELVSVFCHLLFSCRPTRSTMRKLVTARVSRSSLLFSSYM